MLDLIGMKRKQLVINRRNKATIQKGKRQGMKAPASARSCRQGADHARQSKLIPKQALSDLLRLHSIYFRKQVTGRLIEKRQKIIKRKPHRTVFVDEDISTLRYAEKGTGVVELANPFIMIA